MEKANYTRSLLVISVILIVLHAGVLFAQEGCFVPTVPSIVEYPEGWSDGCPIQSTSGTIERNGYVDLALDSGCAPCSPYTWSVSGKGFSLTNAVTETPSNRLRASSISCGVASVVVQDACGAMASVKVRSTYGHWELATVVCENEQMDVWDILEGMPIDDIMYMVVVGADRICQMQCYDCCADVINQSHPFKFYESRPLDPGRAIYLTPVTITGYDGSSCRGLKMTYPSFWEYASIRSVSKMKWVCP